MKRSSSKSTAKKVGISQNRMLEARLKANLISAIIKAVEKDNFTHAQVAKNAGLSRSTVTGILSGSLQKVTLDRILRLVEALGLSVELKVHK
jgi:predicted XRE-type DNA-binding protein